MAHTRNYPKLSVTMPPHLQKELDDYAIAYGLSRSGVIQLAVRDWLPKQPRNRSVLSLIKHNHQIDPTKIIPSARNRGLSFSQFMVTEGKGMELAAAMDTYENDQYEDST